METQERMEREINLKDLFWGVIFGWRQMICFGILFAILVSGMRYFLDVRSYDAQQNVDVEFERGELEEEDARKIADAVEVAARKEGYEKYLDTAAIMQVDPYKKPVVGLQYYVDSDYVINYTKDSKHDYTNDIMAMYANYIKSGEVSQKVIEMAGLSIESEEFSELCSVEQTGSTMTIWITYPKEDKLDTIADAIRTLVSEKEPELQTIGSHTLKELEGYKNTVVDTSLLERKTTIINTIASLDTQLTNAKSAMTPQQLSIMRKISPRRSGKKRKRRKKRRDSA